MFFKKKNKTEFACPLCGEIMPLANVPDPVFAQGMMGDGFAVELTDGKVVAPFDGEITVCYPTGHAIGLTSCQGVECLIHLGIDTVTLGKEGFDVKIAVGKKVKTGDELVQVNIDLIKEKNLSVISPVLFTDGTKINLKKTSGHVDLLEEVIEF